MHGKITTFWSARGGSGSTLLSVCCAVELSKRFPGEVVLVDLSESLPHIHHLFNLNLQHDTTKLRGILEKEHLNVSVLDDYLHSHRGLNIMLPCADLYEFTKFNAKHYTMLLKILTGRFKYIVVDTNAGIYFSSTYASLSSADIINVIIRPDRHSIITTKAVLEFITSSWRIPRERLRAILNCVSGEGPDAELVTRVLGISSEEIKYNSKLKAEFDAYRLPTCLEEASKLITDSGFSPGQSVQPGGSGGGDRSWVLSIRTR